MTLAAGLASGRAQMVPVTAAPADEASLTARAAATELPADGVSSSAMPAPAAGGGGVQLPPSPPRRRPFHAGPFSTASMGLTAGTLGPGVELAMPLARALNVRVSGTYLNLSYPFTIDGADYNVGMKLTSGMGVIDWFPSHGAFHVSAGALYFKSAVGGAVSVTPGQRFKLGGTEYLNSVDDPVQGTASLDFPRRLAPVVLMGFGNLIPRSGRHLSVPIEIGGAYLQPPQINLQLAGTACTTEGCGNAATDPSAQADLQAERTKLNRDIRPLQIYPIVSIGFALRF